MRHIPFITVCIKRILNKVEFYQKRKEFINTPNVIHVALNIDKNIFQHYFKSQFKTKVKIIHLLVKTKYERRTVGVI